MRIASARTAALLDPEGEALAKCLADVASSAGPRHRRRIDRGPIDDGPRPVLQWQQMSIFPKRFRQQNSKERSGII